MKNEISQQTLDLVMRQYGEHLLSASPLSSFYARGTAYKVRTEQGMRVIKPWTGGCQQLQQLKKLINALQVADYSHAPSWFTTSSGEPFATCSGRWYYVTNWVMGTPFSPTRNTCRAAGQALAQLHQLTVSHTQLRQSRQSGLGQIPAVGTVQAMPWLRELQRRAALFQKELVWVNPRSTGAAAWFRNHGQVCQQMTRQGLTRLNHPSVSRRLQQEWFHPHWLHGDVTVPNLIQTGSEVVLLDWDRAHPGIPTVELAKSLANVCGFCPDFMTNFIRGYMVLHPLSAEERKLVVAYLHLPWEAWNGLHKFRQGKSAPELPALRRSWSARLQGLIWARQWADSEIL